MNLHYLLIVEGEVGEYNILHDNLVKHGYYVNKFERKFWLNDDLPDFNITEYQKDKRIVTIVQGPQTRICNLISDYDKNCNVPLEFISAKALDLPIFAGIYFIYDVDFNDNASFQNFYSIFNNPQDGLLLVSNPCIEVLADKVKTPNAYTKITQYKEVVWKQLRKGRGNLVKYIAEHFNELIIETIKQNSLEFNENNVSEHPDLLLKKNIETNKTILNDEGQLQLLIRCFSTVIYVFIADIENITKDFDNTQKLIAFFEKHK
ncbi:MAG TPA: hypothetical protein PLF33_05840 [Bacilli bacterium]|nr:hypothetical protein [Bacilli bacterium]